MPISEKKLISFIKNALREDIGDGDHSSLASIPLSAKGKAHLLIKENGILAGVALAKIIFQTADKNFFFKEHISDGTAVRKGDIAFIVEGSVHSILKTERLVLNCMQRMSGIATATHQLKIKCKGTKSTIIDTRKTSPGLRFMEKWAVVIGGGDNHRMGLYDMIMLKDNHLDYAGGIEKAIKATHLYLKKNKKKLKIEVEARDLKEVKKIISAGGIDRIMLDNFSIVDLKKAVKLINGKFETEASGGITEKNIRSYALCGVDFISVGALTHSVKSLDMSLKAI